MADISNVDQIAELACLKIEVSELDAYRSHFEKVLQYFKSLESVNTEKIRPMVTPHDEITALRPDHVEKEITTEEILQNAPEVKDSLFKVPPVV